jgi:anti-anti-sigma factor
MDCQILRTNGVAEVVIVGSLDSSWSSYLSERLDEVIRGGALEVRLDMAGVSYLSSNGIALLVRYHKQLRRIGGRFRVVADSEAVSYVLGLTGVSKILGDDGPAPASGAGVPRCEVVEQAGMTLQVFPRASGAGSGRLEHGVGEVLDELAQLLVEVDDLDRAPAQDGIAEQADGLDHRTSLGTAQQP